MLKRIITGVCTLLLTLSAAGQQTPDLRVMSFNIERGDLGVKKNRGWERRKDACLKILQTRKPTLLGLQECNSTQRDDVKACLEGYYTPVKRVMKLAVESCAVADKGSTHSGYTGKSNADLAFEKEPASSSGTPWAELKADADDANFTIFPAFRFQW